MSYQRIATPRAYLDIINPLLEKGIMPSTGEITGTGLLTTASSIIQLFDNKPNNSITLGGNGTTTQQTIVVDTNLTTDDGVLGETMFVAILNHNFDTADVKFKIETDDDSDFSSLSVTTPSIICNATDAGSNYFTTANNGWSLVTYTQNSNNRFQRLVIDSNSGNYDADIKIGCILWGVVYDFPNSPDINIKKSLNYDGVKINESLGGQKYAHATHLSNSDWDSTNAWGFTTEPTLKSGRKKLSMSFSYLSDSDIFSSDYYKSINSQQDDAIVPKILYLTNGGMYPFLLQYDKDATVNIHDGFLWCRLDKEPVFNQVSNNIYSTELSFVEEF